MHTDVRCDVVYIPHGTAAGGWLSASDIFFVIKLRTARPRGFRFGRPRTTFRRATAVFNPLRTVYRTLRGAVPNPFRDILPRWARRRTVLRRR